MMGVCWPAAADQTRLLGNQSNVITVTKPARHRQREHALIYKSGCPTVSAPIRTPQSRPRLWRIWKVRCNICELGLKSLFDVLGIGCSQSVFGGEYLLSPVCGILGRVKVLQSGGQLIAQRGRSLGFKRGLARI